MPRGAAARLPEIVQCGGCGRDLVRKSYSGHYPSESTPADRITRLKGSSPLSFCVFCTCGHYTIFEPRGGE